MTAEIINIILMASLFFLLGCILYVGYKLDETNDKLNKLKEFVYKDEEPKSDWMYAIFNQDDIKAKKEQWTKEAEEAGMTLTEYLESIKPTPCRGNGKSMTDIVKMLALDVATKALEQEDCEDAISRQAVNKLVDELARAISDERCYIPQRSRSTGTIMQDILNLPSVTLQPKTGHWIPVTERLPEENTTVIGTNKYDDIYKNRIIR